MKKGKESEQEKKGGEEKTQTPSSLLSRRPCTAHLSLPFTFSSRASRKGSRGLARPHKRRRRGIAVPNNQCASQPYPQSGRHRGAEKKKAFFYSIVSFLLRRWRQRKEKARFFWPQIYRPKRNTAERNCCISVSKNEGEEGGGMSLVFLAFSLV